MKRGYMLDMKASGFGLVELGYHAQAVHADPLTDQLFLVLDANDEQTETYLPLPDTSPVLSSGPAVVIYAFDSPDAQTNLVYRWKGRLNLLPKPAAFTYCQVKADDYENVILNLYGDSELLMSQLLFDSKPFTLPITDAYEAFEIELVGTSRVRTVQVSEDIEELM